MFMEASLTFLMWFAIAITVMGVFVLTDRWLDQRKFEREMREQDEWFWSAVRDHD